MVVQGGNVRMAGGRASVRVHRCEYAGSESGLTMAWHTVVVTEDGWGGWEGERGRAQRSKVTHDRAKKGAS